MLISFIILRTYLSSSRQRLSNCLKLLKSSAAVGHLLMMFLWWEHMWWIGDVWSNSGLLWCHNPRLCLSQGHVMDNRPEPQLRACACVWGGVTRIGYKYSRALLIMNRCTWAFLSPESRRSPETGRTLWNASSSCSLAVCLRRPHQKLCRVQRFSHDTEFLSLVLFFPSALQTCWTSWCINKTLRGTQEILSLFQKWLVLL